MNRQRRTLHHHAVTLNLRLGLHPVAGSSRRKVTRPRETKCGPGGKGTIPRAINCSTASRGVEAAGTSRNDTQGAYDDGASIPRTVTWASVLTPDPENNKTRREGGSSQVKWIASPRAADTRTLRISGPDRLTRTPALPGRWCCAEGGGLEPHPGANRTPGCQPVVAPRDFTLLLSIVLFVGRGDNRPNRACPLKDLLH